MNLIAQSTSYFGSLKNAVLGNPVTREFTIGAQIGSFGPGLLWKVFEGKKKSTGQDVSVFIFEKALVDKYGRKDREEIFERMRHGPQQLTKLRHPRILTVQHPLEESRDSLAFATEPVFASLSNIFQKHENFSGGMPPHLKGFELYAVEKVYGLLQVAEGLAFLHNDASLCEGNITPDNIIVTKEGQWKLAGFHFSISKATSGTRNEYTTKLPPIARQDLNYLAPEYIFARAGPIEFDIGKADMFSFGCLISAIYNHLKTPFDAGDNIAMYKKCTEQLSRLGSDYLKNVPTDIRDHVSLLLNAAGETRPDASSTITHRFFDDVAAMTLKYLDSLVQRDNVTKSQFFKNLHHVLDKLPLRVLHQRILPPLFSEFPSHMMIPFVLPNVFNIAEKTSKEDYMRLIFPELKKIFDIVEPIQVLLIFMQKMELMLKMTDKDAIKNFVLPLIFKALEAPSEEIQELVLTIIPNFVHMIDYSSLKNSIIPRLKVLITKTQSLRVRVNSLVCLGKIIDNLDKFLLVDEIFPIFKQIPSKDPAVLMAILGIYKQTLRHSKINLEKDYLATSAIPFLLPLSVEPKLNVSQFNNFMSVIREMFDRVEQEHRTKLEQLQKMQDEQRSSIDFVKAANKNVDTVGSDSMMAKVDNLVIGSPSEGVTNKKISADSEFAKMFGISDEPKKTNSKSLMDNTRANNPSVSKTPDVSSFDNFSKAPNNNAQGRSSYASNNQTRGSGTHSNSTNINRQPNKQSVMVNSMMNSQLNNMGGTLQTPSSMGGMSSQNVGGIQQPSLSMGGMSSQNMGGIQQQPFSMGGMSSQSMGGSMNSQPFNRTPYGQNQQNFNSGYPSKPQTSMTSGNMMQNARPQQMYTPHNRISAINPTMPMNSMNQNAMIQQTSQINPGILQPVNQSMLLPMNSSSNQPTSNLSSKDLDDLLL